MNGRKKNTIIPQSNANIDPLNFETIAGVPYLSIVFFSVACVFVLTFYMRNSLYLHSVYIYIQLLFLNFEKIAGVPFTKVSSVSNFSTTFLLMLCPYLWPKASRFFCCLQVQNNNSYGLSERFRGFSSQSRLLQKSGNHLTFYSGFIMAEGLKADSS